MLCHVLHKIQLQKAAYLPKCSSAYVFEHAVGTIGLTFFYQQELLKSVKSSYFDDLTVELYKQSYCRSCNRARVM